MTDVAEISIQRALCAFKLHGLANASAAAGQLRRLVNRMRLRFGSPKTRKWALARHLATRINVGAAETSRQQIVSIRNVIDVNAVQSRVDGTSQRA